MDGDWLGTCPNNPKAIPDTIANTQHRVDRPRELGEATLISTPRRHAERRCSRQPTKLSLWHEGMPQGTELLNLWMSGTALDYATFDSDSWGDYMRAAPDLKKQIRQKP
jgi:hypothetical protein